MDWEAWSRLHRAAPRLRIAVITTDAPQVAERFFRALKKRYGFKFPLLADVGGRTTWAYCRGRTPCAFLVDEHGRLQLKQEGQEDDQEVTYRILKEIGGDVRVHTTIARTSG